MQNLSKKSIEWYLYNQQDLFCWLFLVFYGPLYFSLYRAVSKTEGVNFFGWLFWA